MSLRKVRTFIWWPCSNILPTRDNLHRKKLRVDPRCEPCCRHHESTGHLLWECPFAKNVWALCSGRVQKCSNLAQDFFLLFGMMVRRQPQIGKDGPQSPRRCGMLEISFISGRSSSTQERFWMAPLDF